MDVDTVVIAVGTVPNPLIASNTPELKTTKWGTLVVDERGRTTMEGVWAGGRYNHRRSHGHQRYGRGKDRLGGYGPMAEKRWGMGKQIGSSRLRFART